jgi:hypothetical protein
MVNLLDYIAQIGIAKNLHSLTKEHLGVEHPNVQYIVDKIDERTLLRGMTLDEW